MPTFTFNKIIKTLIVTDVFIYSSWGLIMPILAVFIVGSIQGGDASVVGMAIGIYWLQNPSFRFLLGSILIVITEKRMTTGL